MTTTGVVNGVGGSADDSAVRSAGDGVAGSDDGFAASSDDGVAGLNESFICFFFCSGCSLRNCLALSASLWRLLAM
jgi:hypothetical protein